MKLDDAYRKAMMLADKWLNVIRDAAEKEIDCSCMLCVCENASQCQGCGAKKCEACKKAQLGGEG